MKVEKKQVDDLNIELTMTVEAADYAPAYRKKFSERKRTAEFKGFRRGMVPASMIRRVYGEQILVDAVNEQVGSGLNDYINESKLHILGEPLNSENQPEIEWREGNDFVFVFDVALSPEFSIEVDKDDTISQYSVIVAAKDKASGIDSLKKYYEERKETKTDEEIEAEVTVRLKNQYSQESEWRLAKDIRDYFVDKAGIKLPEAFLKRWLLVSNQGKFTAEDIDNEFPGFVADFKWQMVRGRLMEKFGLKVTQDDITEAAENFVKYHYSMYGMANLPAEILKDAVNNVISDSKQVDRMAEQVEDTKVIARIKEIINIKSQKISATKFRELQ